MAATREQIGDAIAGRYAEDVSVRAVTIDGAPGVEITVRARIPALGLGGPAIEVEVSGRAVEEPDR